MFQSGTTEPARRISASTVQCMATVVDADVHVVVDVDVGVGVISAGNAPKTNQPEPVRLPGTARLS